MPAFEWNEARFEIAKTMWSAGVSATTIACDLGCSRNAVIGKMHRNGLTKNPPRAKAKAAKPQPRVKAPRAVLERIRQAAITAAAAPVAVPTTVSLVTGVVRKTMMELGATDCRWPLGNPNDPNFRFCGAPQCAGLSYCAGHARIAYVLPARRKGGTDGEAYKPKTNGFGEALQ